MPKTCKVVSCKRLAKWISSTNNKLYICDLLDEEHISFKSDETFIKLVNSPCTVCKVKEATFGPVINGKVKRMYCKEHSMQKSDTVIQHKKDVKRKCEVEGCIVEPSYCNPGETRRRWCNKHKPVEYTRNDICQHVFDDQSTCKIQACYNFPTLSTALYCNNHKLDHMINIHDKNRGCNIPECVVTRATFGFRGDEKPTRCANHKNEGMEDIINKKCTSCGLFIAIKANDFTCSYCSPTHPRQRRTKEQTLKTFLETHFSSYNFTYNQSFKADSLCMLARYRPDFSLCLLYTSDAADE